MRPFQALIHDPSLWATHRKAVVPAVAAGVFIAFIPIPLHPLIATLVAIIVRINLPVILVVVWISNPLTIGPILLAAYSLGSWILGKPPGANTDLIAAFGQIWDSVWMWLPGRAPTGDNSLWPLLNEIWQPSLLGLFVIGSSLSLLTYFGLNVFWRWATLRRKRSRRSGKPASQASRR